MEEIKELKISVPWGYIAAKAWGCSSNFPVLCVHGLLDNAGAFSRLIPLLPKSYYYVSIDLPGHGYSSHFPPGIALNFFNYVLALKYVTETLKWKTFNCIGHSLGGQLCTFYSLIYPKEIQKLVSIEGIVTLIRSEKILEDIRKVHKNILNNFKDSLYTYDEIIYALRCKRNVCLKTKAAEALFKRAVTEINGMYKFNRDPRLRAGVQPYLSIEQVLSIFKDLDVKILLFVTNGSLNNYKPNAFGTSAIKFKEIFENVDLVYVDGNHDVHNNHPENISNDISKFLNNGIQSKL